MKDKMLILTNRPLHNGPRMIREFNTFQEQFDIVAFGRTKPTNPRIEYIDISTFLPLFNYILIQAFRVLYYYKLTNRIYERYPLIEKYILSNDFKIIIIHDPTFLPLVASIKKKLDIKVIYNAHEYHPLEFEERKNWVNTIGRYHYKLCRTYFPSLDLLVNVCEGIAQKCKSEFGIESIVIPNAASGSTISPSNNEGRIRMIYHGAIMKSRGLEAMLDVAGILGNEYQLDIMAVASPKTQSYFDELRAYSTKFSNISFLEPVPFNEIVATINKYDIGLYMLMPTNFNNFHALPNKLFEFIQAKLAIAIGPSEEMRKYVEKYEIGVVSEQFTAESLATKVREISRADIVRYKKNAVAASLLENAEVYSDLYLAHVQSMILS